MKKFALHKTVMLVAALAIGSAGIAGDALARGGGGGGFGGHAGGFGGGHFAGGYGGNMGHFSGPRFGGGYTGNHVNQYGHNDFHNRHVRVVSPYLFDDYGYDDGYYGSTTTAGPRSASARGPAGCRSVWACY